MIAVDVNNQCACTDAFRCPHFTTDYSIASNSIINWSNALDHYWWIIENTSITRSPKSEPVKYYPKPIFKRLPIRKEIYMQRIFAPRVKPLNRRND